MFNLPNTGQLYTVSSDAYGDETATFDRDFACIIERTDSHSQSGLETSAGGSTVFADNTMQNVKGRLLLINTQWYRVLDEFLPQRSFFTTEKHHVELAVERVASPEVIV